MTDTPEDKSDVQPPNMTPLKSQPPELRFFGRRKGPSLSGRKQSLIDDLLPTISVPVGDDTDDQKAPLDLTALFKGQAKQYWLEIGFGKGEHLAWQAQQNPQVGLIGCEPYLNGVAGLLSYIDDEAIENIRIYGDDARHVLKALPDASLERVFLIHPDPWPKRRHARRRFMNPPNLDQISRALVDGGEFRVGTDHPIYREWTALQMSLRDDFVWLANGPEDWQTRPDDWPETRYEAKALEGKATYFIYKRADRSV